MEHNTPNVSAGPEISDFSIILKKLVAYGEEEVDSSDLPSPYIEVDLQELEEIRLLRNMISQIVDPPAVYFTRT